MSSAPGVPVLESRETPRGGCQPVGSAHSLDGSAGRRTALAIQWGHGALEAQGAPLVDLGGGVRGAVLALSEDHHRLVAEALFSGRFRDLPDVPWFGVVSSGDELIASTSPMIPSGVFWSTRSDGVVVVASDPLTAARSVGRPEVDPGYLRAYLEVLPPVHVAPFRGIRRAPPGVTLTWRRGTSIPELNPWLGPEAWGEPDLGLPEAQEAYLETFDKVVAGLLPHVGHPVSSLSAGLDSTFVAASLARQLPEDASAVALHSAALLDAPLAPTGDRDPDESPLVLRFAQMYPALELQTVRNVEHVRPLEAAAESSARSGVPTWSPSNQVWINAFHQRARAAGGLGWFEGSHGNVAFSHSHGYAGSERAVGSSSSGPLGTAPSGLVRTARRVVRRFGRIVDHAAARTPSATTSVPGIGQRRATAHDGEASRSSWIDWLTLRDRGPVQARNPASGGTTWRIDPFLAPSVLELAARIRPEAWRRGFPDRAFARSVSSGRIPDEIRLRTTRGAQGADSWFVVRHDRDDYLDRIAQIAQVPGLESVDARMLGRHVASWPWGEPVGPPHVEQAVVERLLGLAAFGARRWGE